MAIKLILRNALTSLSYRNDFATHVSVLASQASHRLLQLSASVERYTDQEKGLTPKVEHKKVLYDDMDQRFEALWSKLSELQATANQRRKR